MIDASSNYAEKTGHRQPVGNNYSTATITKRKNPIRGLSASNIQRMEHGLTKLEFTDVEIETQTNASHIDSSRHEPQQYEDMLDVQVIAKMQEECKCI